MHIDTATQDPVSFGPTVPSDSLAALGTAIGIVFSPRRRHEDAAGRKTLGHMDEDMPHHLRDLGCID